MPTLKPLPDCEGPKLECFTDDLTKHNFEFLQLLGSGCHSTVVKVDIDGKIYVIKLVGIAKRTVVSDANARPVLPYVCGRAQLPHGPH